MLLFCLKGSHDLLLTPHLHLISCQFFSYCPSLSHTGLLAVLWRHQPHSHSQPFYCYTRQAHSFFRWLCLVDRGVCPNTPFSQRRLFHGSAVPGGKTTFPLPLLQASNCDSGLAIRHTMCSVRGERGPGGGQSACGNAAVSTGVSFFCGFHSRCPNVCSLCTYPEAGWGALGRAWPGPWLLEQSLPQYSFGSFPGHSV